MDGGERRNVSSVADSGAGMGTMMTTWKPQDCERRTRKGGGDAVAVVVEEVGEGALEDSIFRT